MAPAYVAGRIKAPAFNIVCKYNLFSNKKRNNCSCLFKHFNIEVRRLSCPIHLILILSIKLRLATGICDPSSCILWFFNPVTDPVLKRILVKTRKKRITDPKNTEGGIADPTNHAANFPHLLIIAYPRGQRFICFLILACQGLRPTGYAHYTHKSSGLPLGSVIPVLVFFGTNGQRS
jgi:hypothetical protein